MEGGILRGMTDGWVLIIKKIIHLSSSPRSNSSALFLGVHSSVPLVRQSHFSHLVAAGCADRISLLSSINLSVSVCVQEGESEST